MNKNICLSSEPDDRQLLVDYNVYKIYKYKELYSEECPGEHMEVIRVGEIFHQYFQTSLFSKDSGLHYDI